MKNRYKQKLIFVIAILCLSLVSCKNKTEPINNIASWTLDDGWTINEIDIRDDYANFTLLYQDREIANVEISKFAEPSWIDRETTADEFVHRCCTLAFSIIFYIISYIFFTLNTISELFITLFHNFQSRSCCLEKVSVASHFTFPRINLRNFHLCL